MADHQSSMNGNHHHYAGMEKDLNEGAAWKRIQQNTFTRWVNEQLKCVNKRIENLETDFSDGLMLIELIQVLSHKKIPRFNKKPTLRTHKLENVSLALKFLEEVEKVHLVNIDSSDIVDQRLKLILGLIWTLILKYSISMPIWDEEEHVQQPVKETPKQRLMNWIQTKVPNRTVVNFTSDWRDGKALGALVDSCAPGLCPDWAQWQSKYALENTTEAMDLADNWLGVPKLLEPQEFISPQVDEMSMMTYLSQYPNAKVKVGAPLRPKTDFSQIKVHGTGIEPGKTLILNESVEFIVDISKSGSMAGHLETLVKHNNSGKLEHVNVVYNEHRNLYTVSYTPKHEGQYTIFLKYNGREFDSTPHHVTVEKLRINAEQMRLTGPGVAESGVFIHQITFFEIFCPDCTKATCDVIIVDPTGHEHKASIKPVNKDTYRCEFTPEHPGLHSVNIFLDEHSVPGSPFGVEVKLKEPELDILPTKPDFKEQISTDVIEIDGFHPNVFLNTNNEFQVDLRKVPEFRGDKLKCLMKEPSGKSKNLHIEQTKDKPGLYTVNYLPTEQGSYHFELSYDGMPLNAPLSTVATKFSDAKKCKASGDGLKRAFVNVPSNFVVDTGEAGEGKLKISVEGPLETKINCVEQKHGSYAVSYIPVAPGDHTISVLWDDTHIQGSPFSVFVDYPVDASKIHVRGPAVSSLTCQPGLPVNFQVDASKSGKAPLKVSVIPDKGSVERLPQITENSDNLYDITIFPPPDATVCDVHVLYNDKEIPNSPFRFNFQPTVEPERIKIIGEEVISLGKVAASVPVTFTVDTSNAGCSDLEVILVGPDNLPYPVDVLDRGNNLYNVTFVPDNVGPYSVVVKYGGKEIPQSPYHFKADPTGDASKCYIMEGVKDSIVVNEQYLITVNAAQAGAGFVTCRVLPYGSAAKTKKSPSPVDLHVGKNKDGTFTIRYTVKEPDSYKIVIKFGGQLIPRGEWTFTALSAEDFKVRDLIYSHDGLGGLSREKSQHYEKQHLLYKEQQQQHQQIYGSLPLEYWNISVPGPHNLLKSEVKMPSGKSDAPSIEENRDGSVTIKYEPKEKGLHEMHILYDSKHVTGSPFQFHVDGVKDGYVTAYGPGLTLGIAGEPCTFTVCVKDAGSGGLSVAVDGPAKAELKCHDNKDGTCSVSWIPPVPGEYKILVKFADKEIKGSPFVARVEGESRKRAHISVGSTSEVSLKVTEPDIKGMSASIKSPSGIEEPCFIRLLDDGHLGISFTPREVGEHLVNVKKRNVLLPDAPFRIHVGEREVGNPGKVKLTGPALEYAETQQFNEFVVNTRDAGFGGLSVSIEGPSKCEIVCKENKEGICKLHYKPTEPGIYVLNVKFADHHVPGSPFTVKCQGAGMGTVSEKIQHKRDPANVVFADQECQLCLKIPGTNPMDMAAKLTNPSYKVEDVEVVGLSDSQYVIKFTPTEVGLHTISVFHQGNHISGSPFQFTVGPFKEGGAHKVKAGGAGLFRGEVATPLSFNVYTREAGAGNLSIAIEGPSKAKIDFKDHKDGNGYVTYTVDKPGDYAVAVKFDDQHVPDSPFKVYVSPSTGESRKLEVVHFPDMGLSLNKPATFTILTHGAQGHIDAKVVAPSGAEDDCYITLIDEGESYAVRFIPKEPGVHYVHIKLDGTHMRDSPFRVRVGGRDETDPTAVIASGDGLKGGETGQKLEFIINTCNAGSGILSVSVDGPSKVTLDAYEVDVGYKVRYTPLAPGDYYMTIKYNSIHIPGSPFKVRITGKTLGGSGYNECSVVQINAVNKSGKGVSIMEAPKLHGDASQVECKGMGLKKGHVGRHNTFTVDCSRAGQDLLFAAALTPKGPSEEVAIRHTGKGHYNISYMVKERGVCYVYVKYGHKDVPGSPFPVEF